MILLSPRNALLLPCCFSTTAVTETTPSLREHLAGIMQIFPHRDVDMWGHVWMSRFKGAWQSLNFDKVIELIFGFETLVSYHPFKVKPWCLYKNKQHSHSVFLLELSDKEWFRVIQLYIYIMDHWSFVLILRDWKTFQIWKSRRCSWVLEVHSGCYAKVLPAWKQVSSHNTILFASLLAL